MYSLILFSLLFFKLFCVESIACCAETDPVGKTQNKQATLFCPPLTWVQCPLCPFCKSCSLSKAFLFSSKYQDITHTHTQLFIRHTHTTKDITTHAGVTLFAELTKHRQNHYCPFVFLSQAKQITQTRRQGHRYLSQKYGFLSTDATTWYWRVRDKIK